MRKISRDKCKKREWSMEPGRRRDGKRYIKETRDEVQLGKMPGTFFWQRGGEERNENADRCWEKEFVECPGGWLWSKQSIELVIPETEESTNWAGSLKIRCDTGKSGGDEGKNC